MLGSAAKGWMLKVTEVWALIAPLAEKRSALVHDLLEGPGHHILQAQLSRTQCFLQRLMLVRDWLL